MNKSEEAARLPYVVFPHLPAGNLVTIESQITPCFAKLTVHSRGGITKPPTWNGVSMTWVQPPFWRRVWYWLTPWRVRTQVFVGGTDQ